jgi:hypothetical protein
MVILNQMVCLKIDNLFNNVSKNYRGIFLQIEIFTYFTVSDSGALVFYQMLISPLEYPSDHPGNGTSL